MTCFKALGIIIVKRNNRNILTQLIALNGAVMNKGQNQRRLGQLWNYYDIRKEQKKLLLIQTAHSIAP